MKRKHALKGILFILPSFAGVCVFWLLPYVDVIRRSFLGAVNGVFTGFMNYQMIFSNQAFLLPGKIPCGFSESVFRYWWFCHWQLLSC